MKRKPARFIGLKIVLIIVCALGISTYFSHIPAPRTHEPIIPLSLSKSPKKSPPLEQTSVFVPYWQLPQTQITLSDPAMPKRPIDQSIYFALTPTAEGDLDQDAGYINMSSFSHKTSTPRLLTLKMTNEDINTLILRDPARQDKLIDQTLSRAHDNNFSGILLDFEHSVLPFKEVRTSITAFVKRFSDASHAQNATFAITLFGDTYYRARPYDVHELEPHVDMIYVMAYDFHKAFGEPGPNFPLNCEKRYPYCITRMLDDFLNDVPADKITIVYGLYGYTWDVDEHNRPATSAVARTFAQLTDTTLGCQEASCTPQTDPISAESTNSVSGGDRTKITWYETPSSIKKKTAYARNRGISHFAYWAYGYYH